MAAGRRPRGRAPPTNFGPGAAHAAELRRSAAGSRGRWSSARRLALLIAVGIGLHNFAEGLAIGSPPPAARSRWRRCW